MSPTGPKGSCYINPVICPQGLPGAIENIAEYPALSNMENENPGALAGATGADVQCDTVADDHIPALAGHATAFVDAVIGLLPEDRLPLLEIVIDHSRAGPSLSPLTGYTDEAYFWSDLAARSELKAYLFTCWSQLNEVDRSRLFALAVGRREGATA